MPLSMENPERSIPKNAPEATPSQEKPLEKKTEEAARVRIEKADKLHETGKREQARNPYISQRELEVNALVKAGKEAEQKRELDYVHSVSKPPDQLLLGEIQKLYALPTPQNAEPMTADAFLQMRAASIAAYITLSPTQSQDSAFLSALLASLKKEQKHMRAYYNQYWSVDSPSKGRGVSFEVIRAEGERSRRLVKDIEKVEELMKQLGDGTATISNDGTAKKPGEAAATSFYKKHEKATQGVTADALMTLRMKNADAVTKAKPYLLDDSNAKALQKTTDLPFLKGFLSDLQQELDYMVASEFWKGGDDMTQGAMRQESARLSEVRMQVQRLSASIQRLEGEAGQNAISAKAFDTSKKNIPGETKEQRQISETRIREALKRPSNQPLIDAMADPFTLQTAILDLRDPRKSLSSSTIELGKKVLKLEDLHQWADYENPREGYNETTGQGRWMMLDEEATGAGPSSGIPMHALEVKKQMDAGTLTKEEIAEYFAKVRHWNGPKMQRFMSVLEDRVQPVIVKNTFGKEVLGVKDRMLSESQRQAFDKSQAEGRTKRLRREAGIALKTSSFKRARESGLFSPEAAQIADAAETDDAMLDMNDTLLTRMVELSDGVTELDRLILLKPKAAHETGGRTWGDVAAGNKLRSLIIGGKMTREDALHYLEKKYKDEKNPQAMALDTLKDLERRIGLKFLQENPADKDRAAATKMALDGLSDEEKEDAMHLLTTMQDKKSILQTGLFTDPEKATVFDFLKNTRNNLPISIPLNVLQVLQKIQKFKPLHDWNRAKNRLTSEPLRNALQATLTEAEVSQYLEQVQGIHDPVAQKQWYQTLKKDLNIS